MMLKVKVCIFMHDALDVRPGNIKGHCQMLFPLAAKSDVGLIVSESLI